MNRVFIASAVRTPIGIANGQLKNLSEQQLAATAMNAAIAQAGLSDGSMIDEIIVGTAHQTSLPSNCARHAALKAGIPVEVPAYTVQRQNASGLQAILNGYLEIKNDDAQVILAGGAESMSQVPAEIQNARYVFNKDTHIVFDPIISRQLCAQPVALYGELTTEYIAAYIANEHKFTEEIQNNILHRSKDGCNAYDSTTEICAVSLTKGKTVQTVKTDEAISHLGFVATPADAAAMCVLIGAEWARELKMPLMAEILAFGESASHPLKVCQAAVDSAAQALLKAGLDASQIDMVEIYELSTAHLLATLSGLVEIGISDQKINCFGGALAQGNPCGAAGVISLVRMAHLLQQKRAQFGMIVITADGGQAMSLILRACQ